MYVAREFPACPLKLLFEIKQPYKEATDFTLLIQVTFSTYGLMEWNGTSSIKARKVKTAL